MSAITAESKKIEESLKIKAFDPRKHTGQTGPTYLRAADQTERIAVRELTTYQRPTAIPIDHRARVDPYRC